MSLFNFQADTQNMTLGKAKHIWMWAFPLVSLCLVNYIILMKLKTRELGKPKTLRPHMWTRVKMISI